jgi:hypothetical protein
MGLKLERTLARAQGEKRGGSWENETVTVRGLPKGKAWSATEKAQKWVAASGFASVTWSDLVSDDPWEPRSAKG